MVNGDSVVVLFFSFQSASSSRKVPEVSRVKSAFLMKPSVHVLTCTLAPPHFCLRSQSLIRDRPTA